MLRLVLVSLIAFPLVAQDRIGTVQIRVTTDRSDWRYEPGQPVRFRIVAVQDGHPGQKKLLLALETGHNNIPEQVDEVQAWLQTFLQTAPGK